MAKLYYRGMAEENGKPKVGRSARLLGVRPGIDIDVEQMPRNWLDENGYLRSEIDQNSSNETVAVAIRNTKGMSTSLSIEMSWIFSLSAECGKEQTAAEQFSGYFDRVSGILSNNNQSQCQTGIFQDIEDNWWCRVTPSGIGEVGIDTPETAYIMTEIGILLYQHLRFAPTFRYALVGL